MDKRWIEKSYKVIKLLLVYNKKYILEGILLFGII